MRSDGHMNGHATGHIHRAIAYALVTLGGLLAMVLVLRAYMEAAAIDETAQYLEASVSNYSR